MKKFLLSFFCFFLFGSCLVSAATETVKHESREANFHLETRSGWTMLLNSTRKGKSPAWLVKFHHQDRPRAILALMTVDGRKNEDIQQTSLDFTNGHAEALLYQMLDTQRSNPPEEGFTLTESLVKKAGKTDYISFKFEKPAAETTIYLLMTAKNNYLYSFNCKFNGPDAIILDNLELMLATLAPF